MPEYYQGKFVPTNPQKYVGNTSNIVYRSSWELRVMLWLDSNPDVDRWGSEELIIPYRSPIDHQLHRYFPDFVVKFKEPSGSFQVALLEVKPKHQTVQPTATKRKSKKRLLNEIVTYETNQAKWRAAKAYCEDKGWKFIILTEKDIPGLHHK